MNVSYKLCDTPFFDPKLSWYTERPYFSPCFRNTLLVWLPALIFLISLILEQVKITKKPSEVRSILWNKFNVARLVLCVILIELKAAELVNIFYILELKFHLSQDTFGYMRSIAISTLLAPLIQLLCYILLAITYHRQKKAGIHTSGCIWLYLLSFITCESIEFYCVVSDEFRNETDKDLNNLGQVLKILHLPGVALLFILECRGDSPNVPPIGYQTLSDGSNPKSPEESASFASRLVLCWVNNFLWIGYTTKLRVNSLWALLKRDQAGNLVPRFTHEWDKNPQRNVICVLCRVFWFDLLASGLLKCIPDTITLLKPLLLKQILDYMVDKEPLWHGLLYASLFFILPTIGSIAQNNYFYMTQMIGQNVKSMLISAVYRKSLRLSGSSRNKSTSGEIVNLVSVDAQRFQDSMVFFHATWSSPIQILIAVYLLYSELGWSVFAGIACMILVMPFQAFIATKIEQTQDVIMKTKDERIKQVTEVLSGVKVIKLYAWENSFISSLLGYRNKELKLLNRMMIYEAIQTFFWQGSPYVVTVVMFAVYTLSDSSHQLDPSKAFVSISLMSVLRTPLVFLPMLVSSTISALVASRRISRFLNNDDLSYYVTRKEEPEAIVVAGATMSWLQEDENGKPVQQHDAILRNIDIHVARGSFVAIVGQVASGKSSLLASILGEMHLISGRVNIAPNLRVAYVPQQAWIQNMTIRDNILFSSEFEEFRYHQILDVCSLRSDIEILPAKDLCEIGEKGINLSGGQKQRISLARAAYSNADIYLLDDPLSALDSHVAKQVFEQLLSSRSGILREKTRVLATNSLFVLPHADHVIVMEQGRVVENGTYEDLMKIEDGHLVEFMRRYSVHGGNDSIDAEPERDRTSVSDSNLTQVGGNGCSSKNAQDDGKLIKDETLETGSVSSKVYLKYFKAASWIFIFIAIISQLITMGSTIYSSVWLAWWSSDTPSSDKAEDLALRNFRLEVYSATGAIITISIFIGAIVVALGSIRASKKLHLGLLDGVMHSGMSFFDTTPMGRIVNRFSKDIDVIDTTLPLTLDSWLFCLFGTISAIGLTCFTFPFALYPTIVLAILYYFIQKVFITTTRQLRRLESNSRSPIFSHLSETLSGAVSIRAYNSTERFMTDSDKLVDRNLTCYYPNWIANRWLCIRLELFSNIVTSVAAFLAVIYRDTTSASIAGLTISFTMDLTLALNWLIRESSDLETNIVSVERIDDYTRNEREDLWVKSNRPRPDWPRRGSIALIDYSTRYRPDTDLVLRNINISIEPGEKIGIVGRTGSGKSSLSLSLLRVLESATGKILVDGEDISEFGLHDVRSKITIIPQDPVLFSGTLRFNIDPLNLYSDEQIWKALDTAHVRKFLNKSTKGLDQIVSEQGENFSVGQRQLICLARAVLRNSKILILDEATASVDIETDSIIQKTIREVFADCTILTIAHRLHTILDSDRVMVLDKGLIVGLDTPAKFAADESSAFASLLRDANISLERVSANE